ncbi:MAG: zinc ribbon domain-containing protein, partial [Methanomicrobia archaeon]|nr:zinc ribbon domain-containing protein [Methanomicrobia archaeon]
MIQMEKIRYCPECGKEIDIDADTKFCRFCGSGVKTDIRNRMFDKENLDDRINHLWESAKKLGWSDAECKKAVAIYTELLGLVDETSTSFNMCAIFWNRAMSYRSLRNYDAALEDLARELEIAQRREDQLRVMKCQKIIEETREWKQKAEIEASGGEKAEKFR